MRLLNIPAAAYSSGRLADLWGLYAPLIPKRSKKINKKKRVKKKTKKEDSSVCLEPLAEKGKYPEVANGKLEGDICQLKRMSH